MKRSNGKQTMADKAISKTWNTKIPANRQGPSQRKGGKGGGR